MILLRPLSSSDAAELFPILASVAESLVVDGPETEEDLAIALAEREEMAAAGLVRAFTILEEASGSVMGSIRLKYDLGSGLGEMGVWLGKEFQGRGFGTEAIGRVVEQGFGELGLAKIEAQIFAGNLASRKAFENNGFCLERTVRNGAMQRGEFRDVWYLTAFRR